MESIDSWQLTHVLIFLSQNVSYRFRDCEGLGMDGAEDRDQLVDSICLQADG